MNFLNSDDPIIACSSGGQTNTGIAVIRLSGFKNLTDLNPFFSLDLSKAQTRYAHFTKILDEDEVLDEIILTYFRAPFSFNGENILELSVHGNIFNIQNIIELFCSKSIFRKAYPGEFSYRALKNKKLNLTQIEGLDLFLNAANPLSLKQGQSLLGGSLQNSYEELLDNYKMHKSAIELSIDFLDDVGEEESSKQIELSLNKLIRTVESLKARVENSSGNLINPNIVLVGQPNAGKSSLFNTLLKDNRAIVSEIAGTTRDFINEKIKIFKNFYSIIDTAGLRTTNDIIEEEGIKRAYSLLDKAFFKILLINPFEFNSKFFSNLNISDFDLVLFTKSDLKNFDDESKRVLTDLNISGPIEPIENFGPIGAGSEIGPIEPSLFKSIGPIGANLISSDTNKLESLIFSLVNNKYLDVSNNEPIIVDRHIDSIKNIYNFLLKYKNLHKSIDDISILSSEFNIIGHCISELIGIVSPDEVLHNIFENFCIGK